MLVQKGLLIVYRSESSEDFKQIARRVHKLDPSICLVFCHDAINPAKINPNFFKLPMLVIYLVNPPPDDFDHKAPFLAVKSIGKLKEFEHFRTHDLPCLPIEKFTWGMKLDKDLYGDLVVFKPENMTSTGADVNMVPTHLIAELKPEDFPDNHLIHQDSYLVQKFLKTGERATTYRVTIFLDEVIYSGKGTLNFDYPSPDLPVKELLKISVASNQHSRRTAELIIDEEINAFAMKIAKTFTKNPLLAIDVLREEQTGKLYVLEVNLGGNVWHFSSNVVRNLPGYDESRKKAMIRQYNAWDRAAEALVRKVNELAG